MMQKEQDSKALPQISPPELPVVGKRIRGRLSDVHLKSFASRMQNLEVTVKVEHLIKQTTETIKLTDRINTERLALQSGEWNETGKKFQGFALMAVYPECFLVDLLDLVFLLQQIKSNDEANIVSLALAEVLETEHFVFLINELFSIYIKNSTDFALFMRTEDALPTTISWLVRRLVRLDPDIQSYLAAYVKKFFDQALLIILNDYLRQDTNKVDKLQEPTYKKIQEVFANYVDSLFNSSQEFPSSLKKILEQIEVSLSQNPKAEDKLALIGGYFVNQILGQYLKDLKDTISGVEFVMLEKNIKELLVDAPEMLAKQLDQLFSADALRESLRALLLKSISLITDNKSVMLLRELVQSNKPFKEELEKNFQLVNKGLSKILNNQSIDKEAELFIDYIRFKLKISKEKQLNPLLKIIRENFSVFVTVTFQRPFQLVTNHLSGDIPNPEKPTTLEEMHKQITIAIVNSKKKQLVVFYTQISSSRELSPAENSNNLLRLPKRPLTVTQRQSLDYFNSISHLTKDLKKELFANQLNRLKSLFKETGSKRSIRTIHCLFSHLVYESIVTDNRDRLDEVWKLASSDLKNFSTTDYEDFTFLYLAAFKNSLQCFTLLLNLNQDVNAVSFKNITILYLITALKHKEILQKLLLVNHFPQIDSLNTDQKWTPLMIAAFNGDPAIVCMFLDVRHDKDIKNCAGQTAVDIAQRHGEELVKLVNEDESTQKKFSTRFFQNNNRDRAFSSPPPYTPTPHSSFENPPPTKTKKQQLGRVVSMRMLPTPILPNEAKVNPKNPLPKNPANNSKPSPEDTKPSFKDKKSFSSYK